MKTIEWFGSERNVPNPYVIMQPDGNVVSHSDGTPAFYKNLSEATCEIFRLTVDTLCDKHDEQFVTPIEFEHMMVIDNMQDEDEMIEFMKDHPHLTNLKPVKLNDYVQGK